MIYANKFLLEIKFQQIKHTNYKLAIGWNVHLHLAER